MNPLRPDFPILRKWVVAALLLAPVPVSGDATVPQSEIRFVPVELDSQYPEAIEPEALRYACADDLSRLGGFFSEKGLLFEPSLVKRIRGRTCHIYYEPTLPGFAAYPDNLAVSELLFDVESLNFLTFRNGLYGDTLDIAKSLLAGIPRPIDITVGLRAALDRRWYDQALSYHFAGSIHRIRIRNNEADEANPWVQDYLKGGRSGDGDRALVTRRLFEGRAENGPLFRPLLRSLALERFVPSKISWEGGDLQFTLHPRNPEKQVLFFGDSAMTYWGKSLSRAEYAHVLKQEFGADLAVDLSELVPHVDYLIMPLPEDNIILLSQPLRGDLELARAAARLLVDLYPGGTPRELEEIVRLLPDRERSFTVNRDRVRRAVEQAKKAWESWPRRESEGLTGRVRAYARIHCPEDPANCLTQSGQARMLEDNMPLLTEWVSDALSSRTENRMVPGLLAVIESQLPGFPVKTQGKIDAKVSELEEMGFRVIRVPRIAGDPDLKLAWSGISYTNSLLFDHLLFVPEFGFGDWEESVFARLRSQLPAKYKVVPVYARHMLLHNGGIHCMLGILRKPLPVMP